MKRLRHPIRAIREPFGTAGLIVACVALIAALGGTALAAKGALTGKQKKEVEKIAKKFAGKPGANGAAGTPGPAGKDGANGTNGADGSPGAPGKSVTVSHLSSPSCEGQAGAEVKQEGAASGVKVCNGTTGFTETLPSEATETGVWAFGPISEASTPAGIFGPEQVVPVASFAIPLASPLTLGVCSEPQHMSQCHAHYINTNNKELIFDEESGSPTEFEFIEQESESCLGSAAAPSAEPGNLCIYASTGEGKLTASSLIIPQGVAGATEHFLIQGPNVQAGGTWAVTAP